MKKTAVVIGASGFVGTALTRRLVMKGYRVHGIVRSGSTSMWRLADIKKKIVVHEIGLSDVKVLHELWKKIHPDYFFHTATYGSYPNQNDGNGMIEANIAGTFNLLESIHDIPYTNFIVTGSSSEYGKKMKPMNEKDLLEPNNFYAATKAAQTHLCVTYAKVYNKPVTILRLFNVYGPGEEKGRLVRSVIESVLSNVPVKLATGNEARDLIYVDDVADACLVAAGKKGYEGEIFNIGTGIQTTIHDLARLVVRLTRKKVPILLRAYPGRVWDTKYWKADTRKTKKMLKWRAKHSLEQGIKKTIAWYSKQL